MSMRCIYAGNLLTTGLALLLFCSAAGCYSLVASEDSEPTGDEGFEAGPGDDASGDDTGSNDDSDNTPDDGSDDGSDGSDDPPASPTEEDDAQVLGFDLPVQAECGEQVVGTVTMLNRGTATWTRADGYKLGTVDDSDPLYGPGTRVWLSEEAEVAPGDLWSFSIELEMPAEAGTYTTDWQMVHEQVTWFGEQLSQDVEVSCEASSSDLPGGWNIVACARNGSEICDDESFWVPSTGMESGILCSEAEGGISYIASNTGPAQSDGVQRCQGWEDQGLNAWDHLNYVDQMVCDQVGEVLPIDLSAWSGGSLWFGSHDLPGGGGHMTSTCLVERPL